MPNELLQNVTISPESCNALHSFSNHLLSSSTNAIDSGIVNIESDICRNLLRDHELAINKLEIRDSTQALSAYYLGEIIAIAKLLVRLEEKRIQNNNMCQVSKDSPLLVKCIMYIGDNVSVTGAQILDHLGMKHRSNLSNLISRQKKYDYITMYRTGNRAIYSLTQKGLHFYQLAQSSQDKSSRETVAIQIIDEITSSFRSRKTNTFSIINNLCQHDPSMASFYSSANFANRVNTLSIAMRQQMANTLALRLQEAIKTQNEVNIYIDSTPLHAQKFTDYLAEE